MNVRESTQRMCFKNLVPGGPKAGRPSGVRPSTRSVALRALRGLK